MILLVALLVPALSPTLGGRIVEAWSWRWVFYANLPLALLALRGFTLPDQIFSVDSAATAQALMTKTEDSDIDGPE